MIFNFPGKKKKKRGGDIGAMEVVVLGLSHHNAVVEVREKLAIPEANWNEAASALCEYDGIAEAAVLSTCNRFELYLAGANQYECIRDAVDYLQKRAVTLDQPTLRKNLFMLSGEDAIWHSLRVSAGLDSLVVGEGQILAQVKRSYERGIEGEDEKGHSGQAGKVVSRLLNGTVFVCVTPFLMLMLILILMIDVPLFVFSCIVAVAAGKRVRSETGISKGAVSISSAAAEFSDFMLKKTSGELALTSMEQAKVTVVGAGKMARLLLVHLQTQDVKEVTIVNRSPGSVETLQAEFPELVIHYRKLEDMMAVIAESDIVYPSTASEVPIIFAEPLALALKGRNRKGGIQFVDISVPRNVDPACSTVERAFCYNVDDLKAVVERNTAKRRREMIEAEVILREEQDKFRLWQQSLGAIPTIAKLQEKAESMRVEELQKVSKKLANLSVKDLEAVDRLSKGIVAKLLHGPLTHLKQQKEGDSTREAIRQVQQAFQLDNVDGSL